MNISAKFQLRPPSGFWGDDFLKFVRKFSLSVAIATSQYSGLDKIHIFGREPLRKHFCKTVVKISAVR